MTSKLFNYAKCLRNMLLEGNKYLMVGVIPKNMLGCVIHVLLFLIVEIVSFIYFDSIVMKLILLFMMLYNIYIIYSYNKLVRNRLTLYNLFSFWCKEILIFFTSISLAFYMMFVNSVDINSNNLLIQHRVFYMFVLPSILALLWSILHIFYIDYQTRTNKLKRYKPNKNQMIIISVMATTLSFALVPIFIHYLAKQNYFWILIYICVCLISYMYIIMLVRFGSLLVFRKKIFTEEDYNDIYITRDELGKRW